MPDIPPRSPATDMFDGVLVQYGESHLLATQSDDNATVMSSGPIMLRYGLMVLGKPHLYIVPGLLAVDYGDFFNGDAMWDFVLTKSNIYPRAEVFGYRNDGEDDMLVLKKLDMAAPRGVFAFGDDDAHPIAQVNAVIAPDETGIAPRLLEYLPHYHSFDDWKNRE
ncbi:MAG: hypothetical protein AAF787_19230 [Chloroflexota bacterium]